MEPPLRSRQNVGMHCFPSTLLAMVLCLAASRESVAAPQPAEVRVAGDWSVDVQVRGDTGDIRARVEIPPATLLTVSDERYDSLPIFNPKTAGWVKGTQLQAVRAQETTTPFLLDPASLELRSAPGTGATRFQSQVDFGADLQWGTFGRLAGGAIAENQPVFASYRYAPLRLDSIILTRLGQIVFRPGLARAAAPQQPTLESGERRLANLWIPGLVPRLSEHHLFPILESAYPEPQATSPSVAEVLLPKTLERLKSGAPVRILAWGDSVTDGSYVPEPDRNRWQVQFVTRLKTRFPQANIELMTEAWGGRNTGSYLAEPPGSPHNYQEKVLAAKPDLIVSEFVNDAGLNVDQVQSHYARFRDDFRAIGAEWVILTPHYVRPDWMGLDRERDIDEDPRPYVKGLRRFGAENHIAVADAARRYGRLWRQGIPHTSVMLNSINHPDAGGMAIFADALMELFPKR